MFSRWCSANLTVGLSVSSTCSGLLHYMVLDLVGLVFYALFRSSNGRTEMAHKSPWTGRHRADSVKLVLNKHPVRACGSHRADLNGVIVLALSANSTDLGSKVSYFTCVSGPPP